MAPELRNYIDSLQLVNNVGYEESFIGELDENEGIYLEIRKSENRLYSDNELVKLPYLKNNTHSAEWKLRAKSARRILDYLKTKQQGSVLDLGCGNGWFSNKLASVADFYVLGLDVNRVELEQAAKIFKSKKLYFTYGDIFKMSIPYSSFDFITVGAAIQYFSNFRTITERLFELLKAGGELHVFDSPFYRTSELEMARRRSIAYYKKIGFIEMAKNYHHHSFDDLDLFKHEIMYSPSTNRFINKLTGNKDIPFPWVKIVKY